MWKDKYVQWVKIVLVVLNIVSIVNAASSSRLQEPCAPLLRAREEELAACRAMPMGNSTRQTFGPRRSTHERTSGDDESLVVMYYRKSLACARERQGEGIVRCPCCGWCGAKSELQGAKRKVVCPNCHSRPRHRDGCERFGRDPSLFVPFNREANRPFRLLHFGPFDQMRLALATVRGLDQVMVDKLVKGYHYNKDTLEVDVTDLYFPDNFADGAILLHVMEHITAFDKGLSEVARVMRPGSWLLVNVPCDPNKGATTRDCRGLGSNEERMKCANQWDHVWWFSCADFRSRVESFGFRCPLPGQDERTDSILYGLQHLCRRDFRSTSALPLMNATKSAPTESAVMKAKALLTSLGTTAETM
eukprot:CAMPEP_0119123946 /NCGR_PEP_ID=MMETSP1310-20130426/3707_1 /TAXON_ID=464262 /ORGANISM="Genus nov. species nov., Strain RCC2339" /LENGTH=360 /DNA_ID=CAMNT_0007113819 /DNA_START=52 /DNA_END=1134 /DNA_ORIENTATION=+